MLRLVFSAIILFSATVAAVTLETAELQTVSSSQAGLSFAIDFNAASNALKTEAGASAKPALVHLTISDGEEIPAAVICFVVPPGKEATLSRGEMRMGAKADRPISAALSDDEFNRVRIVEPISIRGMMIGEVVVPLVTEKGGVWYEVEGADISVTFTGAAKSSVPVPTDHFGRMLSQVVANWNEAQSWGRALPKQVASDEYNPFAASGNWVRIRVVTRGVYKITRTDLSVAGVDVAAIDPAGFRLFTAGGKRLPTSNQAARDSLAEIAIMVYDDDGVFSGDDFFMFYGTGPDFWDWSDGPRYNQHPYSDRNVYYLTWGGNFTSPPQRMEVANGIAEIGTTDTLTDFVDYIHLEENRALNSYNNEIDDYFTWYWQTIPNFTLNFNLPFGLSNQDNRFKIWTYGNGLDLSLNGVELSSDSSNVRVSYYTSDDFSSGLNQLAVSITPRLTLSLTDYIEIEYHRPLFLTNDNELVFYSDPSIPDGSEHSYRVSNVIETPYLIDVTSPFDQRLIRGEYEAGTLTFTTDTDSDRGRVFALTTGSRMRGPSALVRTEIDNIRSPQNRADLIFVTHDNFYSQALEFAAYREGHDGVSTRVVKVSDVYAQFSGGLTDPVAIRDFLGYAFRNWSGNPPSLCLLVGDGVYDFRNNLGIAAVNYVPPYIVDDDLTVSDENYVYFDQYGDLDSDNSIDTLSDQIDIGADMVIARWPISSSAEFQVIADKMKRYESSTNFGSWRNLITLIADDQYHGNSSSEEDHTEDSEALAEFFIPGKFDLKKIYSVDYPIEAGNKPDVREDIIRSINTGTLMVNYVGHGNPNVWADEEIFRRTSEIPRLDNRDRLPLIFNASCSIGFFDDPLFEGMAEDFLSYAGGGAVGTVSATRLVYADPNALFNQAAFHFLLGDYDLTIAEAVYLAKVVRQAQQLQENDRKYIYLGDPMTRLGFAPLVVEFESIEPDSFVALSVTELSGVIKDDQGTVQSGFNGTAEISAFDNERERTVPINDFEEVSYKEYGPVIYRGRVDVVDGRFSLKFVIPKDVSYGGRNARISCYAAAGATGAAGSLAPIAIGGINTTVRDSIGPDIRVYFANDPAKGDGAEVNQNAKISMELFDSLGINLSGEVGHSIEMMIDDDPALASVLNDSFSYVPGSYQKGNVVVHLPTLTVGDHRLKIKAWDSANNSSQADLGFTVRDASGLTIEELLCYPNPVVDNCEFSYVLSEEAQDVSLKVFTLSGIEIFSSAELPGAEGYNVGLNWNGRDLDGDVIANGVYIFQLSASALYRTGTSDDSRATATGKLIVMK